MADSTINIFGSSGEAMVGADTINTILASMDSKLTSDDINIETLGDGTVDVDVKNDTYTINLNHTHEGMAKLVVDTADNLPDASEMESDTIYGELDDGEIATIYLGGYPFYGGGGGASSGPVLRRPADGATIDMGQTTSGTVSKTIKVKGRFLTQDLSATLDGTGYTFGTTQPTGVTRNSDTSLTIDKDAARAGVDISVVYTGTSFNAAGTLGIISGSPDNIDVESTLLANETEFGTDGLIGLWDGGDDVQNNAWVDKINGMKLNLGGTATKTNDGYRLDNTGAPKNAWLYLDSADKSTMNNEINKEFTCIVDCLVKFSATGMSANIIDFGNLGTSLSNASIRAYVKQEGKLTHSVKSPEDNTVSATVNNEQIPAFTTGSYVPMRIFCGAKLVNGVQRFFARFGAAEVYSDLATPVAINFSGCRLGDSATVADYAFAAGVAYFSDSVADRDLPNYKVDVIYERILLYNKTLN